MFGEVVGGEMRLNDYGKIVEFTWHDLVNHVSGIALDAFVVMPNHVHGIVIITDAPVVMAATVGADDSEMDYTMVHHDVGARRCRALA
ncbi:MAG: hypothetical protein WHX93_16110 [bacterium]